MALPTKTTDADSLPPKVTLVCVFAHRLSVVDQDLIGKKLL